MTESEFIYKHYPLINISARVVGYFHLQVAVSVRIAMSKVAAIVLIRKFTIPRQRIIRSAVSSANVVSVVADIRSCTYPSNLQNKKENKVETKREFGSNKQFYATRSNDINDRQSKSLQRSFSLRCLISNTTIKNLNPAKLTFSL